VDQGDEDFLERVCVVREYAAELELVAASAAEFVAFPEQVADEILDELVRRHLRAGIELNGIEFADIFFQLIEQCVAGQMQISFAIQGDRVPAAGRALERGAPFAGDFFTVGVGAVGSGDAVEEDGLFGESFEEAPTGEPCAEELKDATVHVRGSRCGGAILTVWEVGAQAFNLERRCGGF